MEAHQRPPEGSALELELKVWQYALAEVPTHHIPTLYQRALAAKRDDYPLRSALLLREWDAMKEDLKREAQAHANNVYALLQAGHGSLDRMTVGEFKARHNLPASWSLGDPYPPESDLYGAPVPPPRREHVEPFYQVNWDARWYVSTKEA